MTQESTESAVPRPILSIVIFLGVSVIIGVLVPIANFPPFWIGIGLLLLSFPTLALVRQISRVSAVKLIGLAYFFLFGMSQSTIGRATLGGVELPLYFSLLPLILLLFLQIRFRPENPATKSFRRSFGVVVFALFFAVSISLFGTSDIERSTIELVRFTVSIFATILIVSLQWQQSDWQHFLLCYMAGIGVTTTIALFFFHFSPLHNYRLAISAEADRANQLAFMMHAPILYLFIKTFLTSNLKTFLFSIAGLSFFGYAILLTASRGGWLALSFALLTVIFLSRHRFYWRRFIILSFLGVAVASQLVANVILLRIQAIFDPSIIYATASGQNISLGGASNQGRLLILRQYLEIIRENPLLGIGVGVTVETERGIKSAHNSYVSIWASAGIFALLTFLAFLSYLGGKVFLASKRQDAMLIFSSGLLVAIVIHSIFENFVFAHFFWGNLSFVILAILIHLRGRIEP